jgi:hypothetical protein
MNPEMAALYTFYLVMMVAFMLIFSATAFLQFRKYRTKQIRLHLWAGLAFVMLLALEVVELIWVLGSLTSDFPTWMRPWHLSALSLFFSLTLLGLSMSGRISD